MEELCRLSAADYDELLTLFNEVFTRENGYPMDFEKELPRMWRHNDEYMARHLAIRENGRIVAALGVYPLPCRIAGQPLLFSTVGNVATHPAYEGRGYMSRLLGEAMRELDRIGADASRLGGLRQRYERFGYEICGTHYRFTLTPRNVRLAFPDSPPAVFEELTAGDTAAADLCRAFYRTGGITLAREGDDFYKTACSWRCTPYVVRDASGAPLGYLAASRDENEINEFFGRDDDACVTMLAGWQKKTGRPVTFRVLPEKPTLVRRFAATAEEMCVEPACNFKILRFDRVTDALMKLRASSGPMPDGRFRLGIRDYGTLELYAEHGEAGCRMTDEAPAVTLSRGEASRFLFGPFPPLCEAAVSVPGWFPLPLSWNAQDRV